MPWAPKRPCRNPRCPELVSGSSWCEAHRPPDLGKFSDKSRGTPQERGLPRNWRRLRRVVLAEEPLCRVCEVRASVQVDHIVSRSQNGGSDRANLQGICKPCHDQKTAAEALAGRMRPRTPQVTASVSR